LESELASIDKSIQSLSKKLDKIFDSYLEEMITKKRYSEMKLDVDTTISKENEKRSSILKKLEDLNQLLKKEGADKYDYNVFKQHIGQAIEYIKIYPAKTDSEIYKTKSDICTMIEVKSKLDWIDDSPIYYHFILSRYSSILSYPVFKKQFPTPSEIKSGKYGIHFDIELSDFKPLHFMKINKYL